MPRITSTSEKCESSVNREIEETNTASDQRHLCNPILNYHLNAAESDKPQVEVKVENVNMSCIDSNGGRSAYMVQNAKKINTQNAKKINFNSPKKITNKVVNVDKEKPGLKRSLKKRVKHLEIETRSPKKITSVKEMIQKINGRNALKINQIKSDVIEPVKMLENGGDKCDKIGEIGSENLGPSVDGNALLIKKICSQKFSKDLNEVLSGNVMEKISNIENESF